MKHVHSRSKRDRSGNGHMIITLLIEITRRDPLESH